MKRKIYQTPHGRVMMQIVKTTRKECITRIVYTYKLHPEITTRYIAELVSLNRKKQQQGFKAFDAAAAEEFADFANTQTPLSRLIRLARSWEQEK